MQFKPFLLLVSAASLVACSDAPVAPARVGVERPALQASEGRGVFQRYVAIGTSVSMGWASDGAFIGTQSYSWPAQLARMGDREITQPYIQSPGCRSPIAPPLAAGVRLSGESVLAPASTLSCAPLVPGVTLPTQNVAVNAARTYDVLYTTPENVTDASNRLLYSRVLPPGATQISAMAAQHPKLVSVELGGNEVLDARYGIAIAGPPPAPILAPALWAPLYREVLDRVEATTAKHGLLVALPSDPFRIPAFRTGAEIAANAPALFVAFNVAVQPDCAGENAANMIFVPIKLATTIQAGVAAKQGGLPAVPFSCAGAGPTTPDFVLTPSEQAVVTAVVTQMNAVIQSEAQARGFALMSLDALFATPGVRVPLDVVALMTSAQPFGPYMSLDGVHPNAAGQGLLAAAAAAALDQRYDLGITTF